jgi:hypothetical protein
MKVREARFEDYGQIEALARRYGLRPKSFEQWAHLWKENPLGDALPKGWVIEAANEDILGYLGNVPLAYQFQGRALTAAATHLWVVDESARTHSIQLLNKYLSQPADLLLNTSANVSAQKIFDAVHVPRVPVPDYDIALYWITEPRAFAAGALKKKRIPLAGLLSVPAGAILSFKRPASKVDSRIRRQSGFGSEFDVFWDELSRRSKTVLGRRDQAWLQWHFQYPLAEDRVWIFTCGDGARMDSYGIFLQAESPDLGMIRVRLIDYQSLDPDCASLGPMLDLALHECQKRKVAMLESIGFCATKRSILESKNPRKRRLPSWLFFYRSKDAALSEQLSRSESWNPGSFDGDSSI